MREGNIDIFDWLETLKDHHGALARHVTDIANEIHSAATELANMARSAQENR
jgi:hypothetical protein